MSTRDTAPRVDRADLPILVASTGGHLEQLHLWAGRWGVLDGGAHWVTFESPQSTDLLAGETVTWVPYVQPRDIPGTVRTARIVSRLVRSTGSKLLVSTGAAVAVSAALAGIATRTRFVYIESLARVGRLSLTGRIIARIPGVRRFVQSTTLANSGFSYAGTVLEAYSVTQREVPRTPRSVFVTVGTIRPYGFDRLLQRLDELLVDHDVTWQVGSSTYTPTHGTVHESLDRSEALAAMSVADVVVTHAGVGSILSALSQGKVPVVVARESRFNEHIDDHQREIAELASSLGYAVRSDASTISLDDLEVAASRVARASSAVGR